MQFTSVTYTSLARLDLQESDLEDIFLTAREQNALDGVTGLLVFNGRRPKPDDGASPETGVSAVLAASIFHYGEHSIGEAKRYMASAGLPIRLDP